MSHELAPGQLEAAVDVGRQPRRDRQWQEHKGAATGCRVAFRCVAARRCRLCSSSAATSMCRGSVAALQRFSSRSAPCAAGGGGCWKQRKRSGGADPGHKAAGLLAPRRRRQLQRLPAGQCCAHQPPLRLPHGTCTDVADM